MEIRQALKEQYHAGLAMLKECIELCPEDLWLAGEHPRSTWRIAMHTLFFTQLYMGQTDQDFAVWTDAREDVARMWTVPAYMEPYELEEAVPPMSKSEVLGCLAFVDGLVDSTVDGLDLQRSDCGFFWYENISKLSHQLMNLRHLQGHVGQLSELLMMRGIDIEWVGKA